MRSIENTYKKPMFKETLARFEACTGCADDITALKTISHVTACLAGKCLQKPKVPSKANVKAKLQARLNNNNTEVVQRPHSENLVRKYSIADISDEGRTCASLNDFDDFSMGSDGLSIDESESSFGSSPCNGEECNKVRDIQIVGIHKTQTPRKSLYFIILVTGEDGSEITIYRKLKEVRQFQTEVLESIKTASGENDDSSYFLQKLKRRHLSLARGTMKRLRMIDGLNRYFQAFLYYKHLAVLDVAKKFFNPNSNDLDFNWCGNGRIYFYVTSSSYSSQRNTPVIDRNVSESETKSRPCSSYSNTPQPLSKLQRAMSDFWQSTENLDGGLVVTSPTQPEIFTAIEDHVVDENIASENVIGLTRGEEVEVLTKCETGWWFVKRCDATHGYVPACFLSNEEKEKSSPVLSQSQKLIKNRSLSSMTSISSSSDLGKRSEYITTSSYVAQNSDEICFSKNSVINVIERNEDGWWLARYQDQEGFVPGVYLKKYNDPVRKLTQDLLNNEN